MARKLSPQDIARGARLKGIRESLNVTQGDFVEQLNAAATRLGIAARYRYYTVSRMESGSITFEDAAVYLSLDPQGRSWEWFVFGDVARVTRLKRLQGGR